MKNVAKLSLHGAFKVSPLLRKFASNETNDSRTGASTYSSILAEIFVVRQRRDRIQCPSSIQL